MSLFAKARALAEEALDLPLEERESFLASRCEDDTELLRQAQLLSADVTGDFLAPMEDGPAIPERIGPFVIHRVLASGGMGTVYEAEQEQPRRAVAVKTMLHGIGSNVLLRRFRVELEALAGLQHPAIAQVFEGGTYTRPGDPNPIPYFAMELVEGASNLLDYAKSERLSVRARMELLHTICGAVQYGHDRGIIHRDLKPGNLLVDSAGNPKLIDYGVAQVRDLDPELRTTIEEQGQILGTLAYLPPEALDGARGDVRGDVYALGVCLYELLTSKRPIEVTGMTAATAARHLASAQRRTLRELDPTLPAELDWIAQRAVDPDPRRRYPSAAALAEDLRNHLTGGPVEAAPPSFWYRTRKTLTRHRLMSSVAAVALAGAAGVFWVTFDALGTERDLRGIAEEERKLAEEEAARTGEAALFFQSLFYRLNPDLDGPEALAIDLLEGGAGAAGSAFAGRPELQVRVHSSLAEAFSHAGMNTEAADQHGLAVEAAKLVSDATLADTLRLHAVSVMHAGDLVRSRELAEEARALAVRTSGEGSMQVVFVDVFLAVLTHREGNRDEGAALGERALQKLIEVAGWSTENTRNAALDFAWMLADSGQYDEAIEWATRTLDHIESQDVIASSFSIKAREVQAFVLGRQGDPERAAELHREALEQRIELYGPSNPAVAVAGNNLGSLLIDLGQKAEAEKVLRSTVDRYKSRRPTGSILAAHNNLGWLLYFQEGRLEEAQEQFQQYVDRALLLAPPPWRTATAYKGLGNCRAKLGDVEGAEEALIAGFQLLKDQFGLEDPRTRSAAKSVAALYGFIKQPEEQATWLERAGETK